MNDLITWLRALLDEDERVAREAVTGLRRIGIEGGDTVTWQWLAIVRSASGGERGVYLDGSPSVDEVLTEIDTRRRILDEHAEGSVANGEPTGTCRSCDNYAVPCPTVRLLALPYAGRDGYLEEWRP